MKIKNTAGLILAEALVAIATLAIAAVALSSIIQNAIAITEVSQDYLIAQNLATEAIEAVKDVRQSNLLIRPRDLFPGSQACWLVLNPQLIVDPAHDCSPLPVADSKYIVKMEGGQWKMEQGANQKAFYRLALVDEQYVYSLAAANQTKYYREVRFIDVPEGNQRATFEVTVEWTQGAKVRQIVRRYTLYNQL